MKFPLAQEVSKHVREKVCKFYWVSGAVQSPATCTITSNDQASHNSQSKAFTIITSDSIKNQNQGSFSDNDKVHQSPSRLIVGQGLELIENNLVDILSPTSFALTTSNENEEIEFGNMIDAMVSEEQVVEVSFTCKLCEFR